MEKSLGGFLAKIIIGQKNPGKGKEKAANGSHWQNQKQKELKNI